MSAGVGDSTEVAAVPVKVVRAVLLSLRPLLDGLVTTAYRHLKLKLFLPRMTNNNDFKIF